MKYVGIDLHEKTIVRCVVNKERTVLMRQRLFRVEVKRIVSWFQKLGEFAFVVDLPYKIAAFVTSLSQKYRRRRRQSSSGATTTSETNKKGPSGEGPPLPDHLSTQKQMEVRGIEPLTS